MPNHFYPSVRHCIYCGETKLLAGVSKFGDEHIIPLALGGNLILPEASCKICERIINREIETPVLSQEWGYLRSKREFPTRNSRTHVFVHSHDGSLMKMPVADYPSPVPLYKFGEPRILAGLPPGTDHLRWTMEVLGGHDSEAEMRRRHPGLERSSRTESAAISVCSPTCKNCIWICCRGMGPCWFPHERGSSVKTVRSQSKAA